MTKISGVVDPDFRRLASDGTGFAQADVHRSGFCEGQIIIHTKNSLQTLWLLAEDVHLETKRGLGLPLYLMG
jgi:hypothetical protein